MEPLFTINTKNISNIDTTILHTSSMNYNKDLVELINKNCEVITKSDYTNLKDIPLNILEEYNCKDDLTKEKLTKTDEIKLNILSSLITKKEVIVFFDILTFIETELKEKVISDLTKKGKRIINYTSDIEETLLLDYIIVIHNNNVIMEGKTKLVLGEEKILKKIGFNLPFIVELSKSLKYYGLVNKIYFEKESLVNDLWK